MEGELYDEGWLRYVFYGLWWRWLGVIQESVLGVWNDE